MLHRDAVIQVKAADEPIGFRHYVLDDKSEPPPLADRQAQTEHAARLELRMTASLPWGAAPTNLPRAGDFITKPRPDDADNPYIPSGYTYFSQFVAHDMVSTRNQFWAVEKLETETQNDRSTRLRLDALYGAGPNQIPIIYAPADDNDLSRGKLQIGRSGPIPLPDGSKICPFRDIARVKVSNALHDLPGLTEALVADQRNDDHALISQLTMVFCHLHNIFIDRQVPVNADDPMFSFTHDTTALFNKARAATTLIYRRLVRDDLLRRLLHPAVYEFYMGTTGPVLDSLAGSRKAGIPLEFSHGAFRFGHAMVREAYQINESTPSIGLFLRDALERFSSARNVHMQPMDRSWLVQWSNFINIPGSTDPARINLSRRIGPRCPLSLFGPEFGAIDPSSGRGMFYRDLISAELANLWRVNDLLEAMRRHPDLRGIVDESPLLQGKAWVEAIAAWLPQGDFPGGSAGPWDGLSDQDKKQEIAAIAADPPLPFFVLFDAWQDPESVGCRLGRFGSILVAETLFGELRNQLDVEKRPGSLSDQLESLHAGFAADTAFDKEPLTLGTVISFINRCLAKTETQEMSLLSLL
ncbi:MAG TPA: hypothetical protein VHB27_08640 [Rhodopila sp.]|uniref:hypothetical protein n=1 Tax=Rhodopila sp. TaxID=2480087 RepID=UPI002B6A79C7|nr:hypothetical protein [Rhodopila sp.]HVY15281.1 hypothetical protein [Rhodopila sp.]